MNGFLMKLHDLKDRYQNGKDHIGKDLIEPCLTKCTLYRRGTGFFSSSSLQSYASVLDRVINKETKIEILASPVVSDRSVIRAIEFNKDLESRNRTIQLLSEQILLLAVGYKLDVSRRDYRSKLLSFLIATEQLELKFAIPRNYDWPDSSAESNNLYHVKMGYFEFPQGECVAFDGSFNESRSGHTHHVDRTQVYRSWVESDLERMKGVREDVDFDWEERNEFIEVHRISSKTLEMIKKLSPGKRPQSPGNGKKYLNPKRKKRSGADLTAGLWRHQIEAVEAFLKEKAGILEMATGTGKTTTALEIVKQLYSNDLIDSIVIATYGNDLLDQWYKGIRSWQAHNECEEVRELRIFRQYESHNRGLAFLNDSLDSILITSNDPRKLKNILSSSRLKKARTLVIHDEIHKFGAPGSVRELAGLHSGFVYRLGLSATPEREYDDTGTAFINSEIGEVVYEFPLENAIEEGILCEFDYKVINFGLTKGDRDRRKNVYARKALAQREGNPWPVEQLYIELSKVVKSAENKPIELDTYLVDGSDKLRSSILFASDTEQGDEICKVINKYTHSYKTYYAGTDQDYLKLLADGKIDCLVACERLNEGIDIRSLNSVFLMSSTRSKLSTIQRIGRCLRKNPDDPEKRSLVVDFVLADENCEEQEDQNADSEREEWLREVSKHRYKKVVT